MRGSFARRIAALVVVALVLGACGEESPSESESQSKGGGDLGVEAARLSPVVDNPFIAFADVPPRRVRG